MEDMNKANLFGKRLRELMDSRKVNAKFLTENVGCSSATISRCINGKHIPNTKIVDKIAVLLNTTTDYLLGNIDNPASEQVQSLQKVLAYLSGEQLDLARRVLEAMFPAEFELAEDKHTWMLF